MSRKSKSTKKAFVSISISLNGTNIISFQIINPLKRPLSAGLTDNDDDHTSDLRAGEEAVCERKFGLRRNHSQVGKKL